MNIFYAFYLNIFYSRRQLELIIKVYITNASNYNVFISNIQLILIYYLITLRNIFYTLLNTIRIKTYSGIQKTMVKSFLRYIRGLRDNFSK